MMIATFLTVRENRKDKLDKDRNSKENMDLFIKGHINDLFNVYHITKHNPFFEGEALKKCFSNSEKEQQTYTSTLINICLDVYGLYYFTHFFGVITKLSITIKYKLHVLDFISDSFIRLKSQVSFHKGVISTKVNRAILNQKSPQKAVEKKSQIVASMILDKAVTKNDTIAIKSIDLFKIFEHGDVAINSDPTKKKYLLLAEEILKKKIQKI